MSNGTDSKVHRTDNIFASTVVWSATSAMAGVYNQLRITGASDRVAIYSPSEDQDVLTFDFTIDDQGWTAGNGSQANYIAAQGWSYADFFAGGDTRAALIEYDFGVSKHLTSIKYIFNRTNGTTSTPGDYDEIIGRTGGSGGTNTIVYAPTVTNPPQGTGISFEWTGSADADWLFLGPSSSFGDFTGSVLITKVIVTVGSGNARARYSSDNGATFGSEVTIGTTPGGEGAFDVQKNGTVSIAAMALKTRKATTWGGAFSDDQTFTTNPKCIVLPWYTRNSLSALNSGSSPEYIVGLDAADGSGNTLYWIVGGSPVDITPEIGGVAGVVVGPNALTTWKGKYLAGLFSFSGVTKCMTSINGGAAWTTRGNVDATAIRVRRLSSTPGQFAAAGVALRYTGTWGNSLVPKTKPSSSDLLFFEFYG